MSFVFREESLVCRMSSEMIEILETNPPVSQSTVKRKEKAVSRGSKNPKDNNLYKYLPPVILIASIVLFWLTLCLLEVFPAYQLPSPIGVIISFHEEIISGRLVNDVIASLWRVVVGFGIAVLVGVPLGLCLGQMPTAKQALVPVLNFFRFLSPLAWIPFAIMWFQIGDKPAIFLIFMASFFPLVLSTMVAVVSIPSIYFRVAQDYNLKGFFLLKNVTLPAILPQLVTAIRMSCGIAWIIIVAAEMVGCQDGLGFGIWDARNGMRLDIAIAYMIIIGLIGLILDRTIAQLTKMPTIRWGYER